MMKKLFTSKRFYISLVVAGILAAMLLGISNYWIMPAYTQYYEGLTVPDVTKKSLKGAQQLLTDYGLRYEIADRRANNAYPADYILDQTPDGGKLVKPNRKVYLTVNTASNPTVIVPDVTNLSLRNAKIQLQNYGLSVGTISYASSRFRNSVMNQSIQAGKTVDKGTSINLTVSDGLGIEMVEIPEIIGLRLPKVQGNLEDAGLRIDEIRFKPSKQYTPNTVLDYSPSGKDSLVTGSSLNLVVSERFKVEEESESGAVDVDTTDVNNADTSNIDNNF